jgi:hypothetical protein
VASIIIYTVAISSNARNPCPDRRESFKISPGVYPEIYEGVDIISYL